MKKIFVSGVLLLVLSGGVQAQMAVSGDLVGGTPMFAKLADNVKGSPYLFEEWKKGNVRLKTKEVYTGLDLKFNQMNNELIFLGPDRQPKRFSKPISEFIIYQDENIFHTFRNGFPAIDKNDAETYYQVLEDGKVKLLKHSKRSVIEAIPYGQSVPEKTILKAETYYLLLGDQIQKIKPDKKQLLTALKSEALANYINSNRMKINNEDELAVAVNFYNNIPQ